MSLSSIKSQYIDDKNIDSAHPQAFNQPMREYRNRKWERPFSPNHSLHIVLKTNLGGLRAKPILTWLRLFLPEKANHFGIKLFHFAILNGHLHLLLQAREKSALNNFLRVIAGVIARKVFGAVKHRPKCIKMWDGRPYSRIISWGREFKNVLAYVERNALEGARRISYVARDHNLVPQLKEYILQNLALSRFSDLSRQPELQL